MSLKEAKNSSTLELMHASTGFWTEVLSMARRVINVIRSCTSLFDALEVASGKVRGCQRRPRLMHFYSGLLMYCCSGVDTRNKYRA